MKDLRSKTRLTITPGKVREPKKVHGFFMSKDIAPKAPGLILGSQNVKFYNS